MNLEIKEKYDNFIKIIEKKEKIEWLKQYNNNNKYIPDLLINNDDIIIPNDNFYQNNNIISKDNFYANTNANGNEIFFKENLDNVCECEISSGYTSSNYSQEKSLKSEELYTSKISKLNNFEIENQLSVDKNKDISMDKNNYQNDNISLLDDNYEIKKSNYDYNDNDNHNDNDSIKSEFKHIFKIDSLNIIKENNNNNDDISTKNKLEKIYTKVSKKREEKYKLVDKNINNNKDKSIDKYNLARYFEKSKNSHEKILKNLSIFMEKYLFEESTRGWNFSENIYVMNFNKLMDNLKKIIFVKDHEIKIGFLYRDFTNPKTFVEKDFTKYWVGNEISSESNSIIKVDYSIKNKILYYSFKNLSKSSKFKKRIGKLYYKFIKKTIQVFDNKDLIIDIIFYVGIKKV